MDLRQTKNYRLDLRELDKYSNNEDSNNKHRQEFEEKINRLGGEDNKNEIEVNESIIKKKNNSINVYNWLVKQKNRIKKEKIEENVEKFKNWESDEDNQRINILDIPRGEYKFPNKFLWGTSTSAYQVEGGITNDWSQWEKKEQRISKLKKRKKNLDNYICGQACDSYNRWEEDLNLAVALNNNAIRFGLEWARIQPKRDTWDMKAIAHYRQVLAGAKKRGLKTVVTLWHWTLPVWIAQDSGWNNKKTIDYFLKYVDLIIKEFGADIDYWVILNEPMIHIVNGYLRAKFPPNFHRPFKAYKVLKNLATAHNMSYDLIHKHYPKAWVSITQIVNYIEPARKWCPIEWSLAKIFHYFSNALFLNKIKNNIDYIGVDYYFHNRVVWYPPFRRNKNKVTNDMGWEIYPKGIYYIIKYLSKFKKPILILENGLADAKDKYRADFIREHLYWIYKAISEGADVRGYFYWSLLDNFEWADGYDPKFGLYAVDRQTFARIARPSAEVYAEICRDNKIQIQ